MFRRVRRTLAHANATMANANDAIDKGEVLLQVVQAFVEDLADGVNIKLTIAGRELPVTVRIDPREED